MPGPTPKPAKLRQRRNKPASQAVLPAESEPRSLSQKPRLPAHPEDGARWHNMARRWWADVWDSPMRYEFLRADEPTLFRLVLLVDIFWRTQSLEIAREIRLMEREFGLTPLSRRRLEWQVARSDEATDRRHEERSKRARQIESAGDPRKVLTYTSSHSSPLEKEIEEETA